jgi:hypothetical protein
MPNATERFRDHEIWAQLAELGPVLDEAVKKAGADADLIEGASRLKAILTFVGKRLADADPFLVRNGLLEAIGGPFSKVAAGVRDYLASGDAGHLQTAQSHADTVLTAVCQLNVPSSSGDVMALKESAQAYRLGVDEIARAASAASVKIAAEQASLTSRVTELSSSVDSERERLLRVSGEFSSQFTAAQDARQKDHSDAQTDRERRFVEALAANALH